ncbi:Bug family tripartite tricarboxylate transporter substrate binding protein [Paracraurococcus lichenis]|uniref:Tripartite tricarboxylate transporter substrate binding protein n=1 Tax=Paracraurococcus lichenis TaxID=3064888 RepID=A0ABT9DTB7_9PROT|nr:tripartite tricarboxylate transporter substrate binding protein [Paracraurococcus sp. LOR1-02]MDO9707128.1 tripartite tricarboxylate transporter substrate binding protein [Paracraurococcus sp. LOR1-02]
MRRRTLLAATCASPALAQTERFPDRPLRMLVPFAPGGPLDITGRPLAEEMSRLLGQTVVFENKPGANGIIAAQAVATAKPDGTTLLYTTGSFVGNMVFGTVPLPYDPERDLAPVSLVSTGNGMMLVGRATLPARDMAELVALAKSKPGGLTCAMTGVGNITHLGAEQFREFTGAELLTLVLQGTGPSITAMLADQVDLAFSTLPPSEPHIRAGRLRAFGYTGTRRSLIFPDVPTMQELGYRDWELIGMGGVWTTGGTPRERILTVQQAIHAAMRTPLLARLMRESDSEGPGSTPEEFAAHLTKELAMQRALAKRIGMGRQ